jgi:hypothetical protein
MVLGSANDSLSSPCWVKVGFLIFCGEFGVGKTRRQILQPQTMVLALALRRDYIFSRSWLGGGIIAPTESSEPSPTTDCQTALAERIPLHSTQFQCLSCPRVAASRPHQTIQKSLTAASTHLSPQATYIHTCNAPLRA